MKRGVEQEVVEIKELRVSILKTGGSHSIIVDDKGEVYSWGLADEGQLGREGRDCEIRKVNLKSRVDMISCGDSFTLAVNSVYSLIYFWGGFRNNNGKMKENINEPVLIEYEQFYNKKIKKIVSGNNHCMILAEGKVYTWGDSETSVLGRMP